MGAVGSACPAPTPGAAKMADVFGGKTNGPTGHKQGEETLRRRVSSVVEHSSPYPKVPGSIPGPVSYRGHGL